MATKRKARRFDDGGGVREGRNENIGDDTRARAMAWVAKQLAAEEAAAKEAERGVVATPVREPSVTRRPMPAPAPRVTADGIGIPPVASTPRAPRAPATSADLVLQIPGVSEQTSRNAFQGNRLGRQPSEAERLLYNSLNAMPGSAPGAIRRAGARAAQAQLAKQAEAVRAIDAINTMRAMEKAKSPSQLLQSPVSETALKAAARRRAYEKANKGRDEGSRFAEGDRSGKVSQRVRSAEEDVMAGEGGLNFRKGGKTKVIKMAKGGVVKSRGDGIAQRGRTKGRFVK